MKHANDCVTYVKTGMKASKSLLTPPKKMHERSSLFVFSLFVKNYIVQNNTAAAHFITLIW